MERHDEPSLRQHAAGQADQLDAIGQEVMEVDNVRPDLLEKLDVAVDEQRIRGPVPPVIVVARQKQKLVRALIKAGDARAALIEGGIVLVDRGEENRTVFRVVAQPLDRKSVVEG